MKKLLLYLNEMYRSGGMERVVSNLVQAWNSDYEVVILLKDGTSSFYPLPKEVRVDSLNTPMKLNMSNRLQRILSVAMNIPYSVFKLRKYLKRSKFDYIYVTNPLNAFEVFLADKHTVSTKLIISEHASINAFNSLYSKMKAIVYPKAYCISVPNTMDTDIYKSLGYNAVYIPHLLTFSAKEINPLTSKIAICVGRNTADKQHSLLIDVWSQLQHNGWSLWIVGDGEESGYLQQKVDSLNANQCIKLLPARKDINAIYRKASLFILSSRTEGFGMVLLEAMAFGIPCISFDCPSGPRDIIQNNINGFLVENGSPSALSEAIQKAITLPNEQLRMLGYKAFKTVEDWPTERILNEWRNIYD